jgi:hypothetical protein
MGYLLDPTAFSGSTDCDSSSSTKQQYMLAGLCFYSLTFAAAGSFFLSLFAVEQPRLAML